MSQTITIRKGLDINMKGKAEKTLVEGAKSNLFSIQPPNFPGLTPKLLVKVGDKVEAGSPLYFDKYRDKIKYVSPCSGTVKEIVRGLKRRVMAIVVEADQEISYLKADVVDVNSIDREAIKTLMLNAGLWPFLRMRPVDIVADPKDTPKSIFISSFDSNPLAPDNDFILEGKDAEFNAGLEMLNKLTDGTVHLQTRKDSSSVFKNAKGVQVNNVKGAHPAGNVGVQMHHIDPINKGEIVWYINPQDVLILGRYALTAKYDASKVVAVCGENVSERKYIKTLIGSSISSIVSSELKENSRVVSGNPLTGSSVEADGFLSFYDSQITVLPEGDSHKFFLTEGWLGPGFKRFSASRAYPTWLMPKSKQYTIDTNINGEERAFVVSGQYEKVFPFDIYPVYLIKSILSNDIESMENLGIYEVAPEDFALCEFVCTSKINVQQIVRDGLDLIHDECM
jgi:Na+-transporting NADH:ubiquinone oxidoreductase subunit A